MSHADDRGVTHRHDMATMRLALRAHDSMRVSKPSSRASASSRARVRRRPAPLRATSEDAPPPECPPSAVPGTTPHSDACRENPKPFGARTDNERIAELGKGVMACGAILFTKTHSGRYRCVNDTFLEMFGFASLDEVLGKTDEELVETLLAKPEHPIFHHSYRGEAITDLPSVYRENDESVMEMNQPRWFKERAAFVKDGRLHEFCIMKAPFDGGIIGVGVLDGV